MLPTPIVQLPPPYQLVTTSSSGAMSAAQNNKLAGLSQSWAEKMLEQAQAITLSIGRFDGGDLGGKANTGGAWQSETWSVIANPTTASWCFAFRGKTPTQQGGVLLFFGLVDATGVPVLCFAMENAVSSSRILARTAGTGAQVQTSFVLDTGIHDFLGVFDHAGGTFHLLVDGVSCWTSTNLASMPTGSSLVRVYNSYGTNFEAVCYGFGS